MGRLIGIYMRLECVAGVTINEAIDASLAFSRHIGIPVMININDIETYITPGMSIEEIISWYRSEVIKLKEKCGCDWV